MRASRVQGLMLLLVAATGLSAAGTIWYCLARVQALAATDAAARPAIDAMVAGAAGLDASMQAFLTRRDADVPWFTKTATLVGELDAAATELDRTLPGVAMAPRARVAELLQRVRETVDGARANLDAGSTLMALDAVQSNGQPAAAALWTELRALRAAVAGETGASAQRWWQRAGRAAAGWVLSWTIGLVWLARRRPAPGTPAHEAAAPEAAAAPAAPTPAAEALSQSSLFPPSPAPGPSMAELADVCEQIGRVREASEIPTLLARAAAALRASGLVLWVREGDALVVAAAHGYPEGLAQRLGRVGLTDETLIARAWHAGHSLATPAGDGRRAALAAPLVGAGGPIGVLAAEADEGANLSRTVEAARLVAGQFAGVLGEAAAGVQGSAGDAGAATPDALAG